jgi:hypothetical protein
MQDQDKTREGRAVIDPAGVVADPVRPDHLPRCIEKCSKCINGSILDRLAVPDAADIEFNAPQAGQVCRVTDFS